MPNLKISRFVIQFKALTALQLPEYAGSALRGAFGHALKSIACFTASRNRGVCCCTPVESCIYRQLFDPTKREIESIARVQDVPPPFIIEAYGLPSQLNVGQTARFNMVIIGEMAHQQLSLIEFAWRRALAIGFGHHLSQGGAQAELLCFKLLDQPLDHFVYKSKPKLSFVTHVRLQHFGQLLKSEDFESHILCNAIFRRYQTIASLYSELTIDSLLQQKIYEQSQSVEGSHNLEWVQWSRYSNRQKRKMDLDGLRGTVQLNNVSEELYYYLYIGQWLHMGKGSVFGLGQYTLI